MNKKFFIVGGLAIILLLLSVWAYLFVYGTPSSADDVFANLGSGGEELEEVTFLPPEIIDEVPLVNVAAGRLRQLTTGPVAGFREVSAGTTSPAVLHYVEMGTGHVYTINTRSGESSRISATTFPLTSTAEISPNGLYYAFREVSSTKSSPLTVGSLSTSTLSITKSYEGTASDISFNNENELYILSRNGSNSNAVTYDVIDNNSTPLFSLPFLEAAIVWGEAKDDAHLVYPKPAEELEGQLYRSSGGTLTRLPVQGLGLTAISSGEVILYNVVEKQRLYSYFYRPSTQTNDALNSPVMVEKCVPMSDEGIFICAQDSGNTNLRSQDAWYTGEISFSDTVWLLDSNTLTGELIFDAEEESGRNLDIIKLNINSVQDTLYFINKIDNTLWMYEL